MLTEEQFLQKVITLSEELGSWLVNIKSLKYSIEEENHQIFNDVYYIKDTGMEVFSASYDGKNKIAINFYIN